MACCGTQRSTTAPLLQARKKWQLQPHLISERLHLLLQRRYLRLLPLHAVGELQAAADGAGNVSTTNSRWDPGEQTSSGCTHAGHTPLASTGMLRQCTSRPIKHRHAVAPRPLAS